MRSNLLLFPLLFLVYVLTMCPTVYVGDSGELTAAAFSLGIPHNSGYPLYAMAGKLFSLIPLGNIGFRLNLMSVVFAILSVWLVVRLLWRLTGSMTVSLISGTLLAVTPLFWGQTVSAEVYTLHALFVVVLFTLLDWWDRDKTFYRLAVFAVVTGLSFGNHLQTVMMAPAVFFFILSGDRSTLLNPRCFLLLTLLFLIPLIVYVYLPVRTQAGAALHWGDPDSLGRFLEHVTAASHRQGFVFNLTPHESLLRLKQVLALVWSQFGVILLLGLWGMAVAQKRWSVFLVLIIVFDLFYTVSLNTASLQVTAFMLPSCIALAILIGLGIHDILSRTASARRIGVPVKKAIVGACVLIPAIFFVTRIGTCDQSRNYTAYEYALNMIRTCPIGGTLIIEGDNHLFPLVYGRLVERMAEEITLYDRHDIVFKMPYLGDELSVFHGSWDELRAILEPLIIKSKAASGVYYAVFDPSTIHPPEGYGVIQDGLLYRVSEKGRIRRIDNPWRIYASESFYEPLPRDFMARQLTANFFFHYGTTLLRAGEKEAGMSCLKRAFSIDRGETGIPIRSLLESFLIRHGYTQDLLREIQKPL